VSVNRSQGVLSYFEFTNGVQSIDFRSFMSGELRLEYTCTALLTFPGT
jgi:hypothetical protein